MTLTRSSSAALLAALLVTLARAQVVPMTNDECATAIIISDGRNPSPPAGLSSNFFTLAGSTASPGPAFCGTAAGDVWFVYAASSTGMTTFSTCTPTGFTAGTASNTIIDVVDGCPATTVLACNDSFCSTRAQVAVSTLAGNTYYIRVARSGTTTLGTFYLEVIPPVTNDECSSPTPIFDGVNPGPPNGTSGVFYSTQAASLSSGVPAMCATALSDLWFSYTATATGNTTFTTCPPTGFTTTGVMTNNVIDVLTDTCPTPTVIACNDNFCSSRGQVSVATTAGTTYLVRVGGVATTTTWGFYLQVAPPLTNDECTSPIPVFDGINPGAPGGSSGSFFSALGASPSAGAPAMCAAVPGDVWLSYTATTTDTKIFSTCTPSGFTTTGTATNTVIDILDNNCPSPTVLACNDDFCSSRAQVAMAVTAGTTYLIRVGLVAATTANGFYLHIASVPANDECANAIPVVLGSNGPFNNNFGTNSAILASCPSGTNPGHKDVFFTFTPTCSGLFDVDTNTTPAFNTALSVFDTCGGTELACNDNAPGSTTWSLVSVTLTAGVPYIIRVASQSTTLTGSFNVNVNVSGAGVAWSSPLGPGSVQFDIIGGPSFGSYYHAIDFLPGGFPNGWFFGIGIPPQEIYNQVIFGFPFTGGLNVCGATTFGPVPGLPSGFTLYSVALTMTGPGLSGTTTATAPVSYTIP